VPLRVLLADDHRLILEAVQRALEKDEDFQVVATTHSGADVPELVARHRPDIVVMDVRMPDVDGLQALDRIRERDRTTKVVMLSAAERPGDIESAMARGADGFILKSVNPADIAAALRQVHEGTVFHPGRTAADPSASAASAAGLTDREQTLLRALARGLSNRQISEELWITEQTVKFHLRNIYRKLDVANRTGAVTWAHEHGLARDEG